MKFSIDVLTTAGIIEKHLLRMALEDVEKHFSNHSELKQASKDNFIGYKLERTGGGGGVVRTMHYDVSFLIEGRVETIPVVLGVEYK